MKKILLTQSAFTFLSLVISANIAATSCDCSPQLKHPVKIEEEKLSKKATIVLPSEKSNIPSKTKTSDK